MSASSRKRTSLRLFPPPSLGEGGHSALACLGIAVCRGAVLMVAERQRPQLRHSDRRCIGLEDAADHGTIGEHDVIILIPLA
jgi:hypothetical protein